MFVWPFFKIIHDSVNAWRNITLPRNLIGVSWTMKLQKTLMLQYMLSKNENKFLKGNLSSFQGPFIKINCHMFLTMKKV